MAGSNEEYQPQQGVAGGGVQGAVAPTLPYTGLTEEDADSLHESIVKMAAASEQLSRMAELTTATQDYLAQISSISEQMQRLSQTTEALNQVSDVLLNSYTAITNNSDRINENSNGYVAQMEDLNRNIGGLNTIYEIQLKSISSQLESIDRVNRGLKDIRDMYEKSAHESSRYCEETERMARYMRQLNQVYEKMITAMTVNMANPMMGGVQQNPFNNNEAGNNL
jgi:chromosome segregation ATPase